jgi:hypothetical protein
MPMTKNIQEKPILMYKIINNDSSYTVEEDMNCALKEGYYLISFHTTTTVLHTVDYCAVMEKK